MILLSTIKMPGNNAVDCKACLFVNDRLVLLATDLLKAFLNQDAVYVKSLVPTIYLTSSRYNHNQLCNQSCNQTHFTGQGGYTMTPFLRSTQYTTKLSFLYIHHISIYLYIHIYLSNLLY